MPRHTLSTLISTLKVHTGPAGGVPEALAARCEEAGIGRPAIGTEHIYPAIRTRPDEDPVEAFSNTLRARHDTTFGLDPAGFATSTAAPVVVLNRKHRGPDQGKTNRGSKAPLKKPERWIPTLPPIKPRHGRSSHARTAQ